VFDQAPRQPRVVLDKVHSIAAQHSATVASLCPTSPQISAVDRKNCLLWMENGKSPLK
jgi:hypothetical protein